MDRQGRTGCKQARCVSRVRRAGTTEADGARLLCPPTLAGYNSPRKRDAPTLKGAAGEPTGDVGQSSLPNRFWHTTVFTDTHCTLAAQPAGCAARLVEDVSSRVVSCLGPFVCMLARRNQSPAPIPACPAEREGEHADVKVAWFLPVRPKGQARRPLPENKQLRVALAICGGKPHRAAEQFPISAISEKAFVACTWPPLLPVI